MITVAICTWNRAHLLDLTLTEMHKLRVPPELTWELLVVNNNCTDETDDVIARHQQALPVVRLFEPKQGHANARNRAIENARGDILLWTDDDVLVDRDWLASLAECVLRHPEAVGFGGPVSPWFAKEPDTDLLEVFPLLKAGFCGIDHGTAERALLPDEHVFGANMAFRMAPIRHLRFQTDLGRKGNFLGGWDDIDYAARVRETGQAFVWCPVMRVTHYVDPSRMTLQYLNSYYEAGGMTQVRMNGYPPCKQVAGIPAWLAIFCVADYTRYLLARFTGRRRQALEFLRRHHVKKGMIKACRERHGGTSLSGNCSHSGPRGGIG
jgi:glycosyltransferase involved in cell wall biosynthesis